MYETINSPFKLGNVTLRNRIIFAPTSMGLKEEEYLEKLGAIARGCSCTEKPISVSVQP